MARKGECNLNVSIIVYTNKGTFWRALALELRRAICSMRFLLSVLFVLVWAFLNMIEAVKTYNHAVFAGIIQLIRLGLEGHESTGPVLLAISTLPYSFSYIAEKECGFQQQLMARISVMTYGISKKIATFISAFLMGATALIVFIFTLSTAGIPHTVRFDEVENTYAVWAATMGPGWYYVAKSFLVGLVCGQAALFSLMVMSRISNAYVGFLSPLIGYYLVDCILTLLARIASSPLWSLVSPMQLFFGHPLNNVKFSYLWTVLVLLALTVCFSIRFLMRLGKEYIE